MSSAHKLRIKCPPDDSFYKWNTHFHTPYPQSRQKANDAWPVDQTKETGSPTELAVGVVSTSYPSVSQIKCHPLPLILSPELPRRFRLNDQHPQSNFHPCTPSLALPQQNSLGPIVDQ